jgi:hypothetical protein
MRRREDQRVDRRNLPAEAAAPGPGLSVAGRRTPSLTALEEADPGTRAMVVGRLQQGAGNASIARIVARQPEAGVADPREAAEELEREAMDGAAVPPHAGGDDSDGVRVAEEARQAESDGPDTLAEAATDGPETGMQPGMDTAAPAPTTAPPPTAGHGATVASWAGTAPKDNPGFATWILDGETHGFVEFMDFQSRRKRGQAAVEVSPRLQMEAIDGSAGAPVLGALEAIYGIVKARADRWLADQSKPKNKLVVGWVVRDDRSTGMRGHTYGESVDLTGGYDWNGANGPAQVMETLDDLEAAFGAGNYGIGLPFQGQFFPPEEEMVGRVERALVAAGPGGTPEDLVAPPSLVRYWPTRRALKWDPDHKPKPRYVNAGETADAVTRLKSAALKAKLVELRRKGVAITVFPDNDNHIHITKS